jgi:cell division protein FtsI/penicillin-binding protein 2
VLTLRGRVTLGATVALALAAASPFALGIIRGEEERWQAVDPDRPSVAIAPAGDHRRKPTLSPPPASVLDRLPVGRDDYSAVLDVEEGLEPALSPRWSEQIRENGELQYQVEYSFDAALTEHILRILKRGRVDRGHVIVLDPRSGRILAYVSTDTETFPPDRSYPAASLIKVVTAAAALHYAPEKARDGCRYRGNRYRLTRSGVHRPKYGHEVSLEKALATSNNQCFAQLAVETVGGDGMLAAIQSFGLLDEPAPGHPGGEVDLGDDDYDLGRLGCGLSGCRITPLHAAQLAAVLATGEQVTPWWIDRVLDTEGRALPLPERGVTRRVMSEELARELRSMMVMTTTRGTARSAFRDSRGRPKLGEVRVAGKTGNLSGDRPRGRYEWFIGAAPALEPSIAIAVLQLQGNLWWSKSSQVAADVLVEVFCDKGRCNAANAERFNPDLVDVATPILLSNAPMD